MIKTILTAGITAFVVVILVTLVGVNQGTGGTRFPNGLSADGTEPTAGQVRGTTLDITSGPNQFGTANTVYTMYFGAADGCSAVRFNSSSTLTTTATSTSFCN